MLRNDAILMMLHCHDDFECVCVRVCVFVVGLKSIKMTRRLPQTVDEGFCENVPGLYLSLPTPPALLPVTEQQSVCELAEL